MVFELIGTDPIKLDRKVQTLEDEVEQLKVKKDRLQQLVDEANRNGEEIYGNFAEWLISADKAIREAEELVQQKEEAKNKYCLMGLFPNLKTLYQLSKNAEEKALAINDLRNEHELDSISFWPPLQQMIEPSLYGSEALPSRVSMMNQIMDSLRDPNLNMIGVYGIGGVGKTTLLQQVQGEAIREKLFKFVVMISISQTPSLRRIQAEIADFFGLKFYTEDVTARAAQLHKRLNKSNVLIILDDLWRKLDLKGVGIPSGEECFGCKVLLSSRTKDVLSCEMQTQIDFSLSVLEEEETWNLFQTTMPMAKDPKLQILATEIAKTCAGLPLLVHMVAKVLQNKDQKTWDDMLRKLSVFGDEENVHKRVHKVLESIFENLPGEEEKSVLLLCALFARSNIPIQYLLIYSIGLDLLGDINSIEEARNRLITLINNLKAYGLLTHLDGYVKMQGMVHDVAISVASKLQHAFIGAGQERLRDWPSNNCTRISLPYCDVEEIYSGLHCPMAELFLLSAEDPCLEIPDLFFEGITGLKVVTISGMCFGSGLPLSLGFLTNLQSLCLNGCQMNDVAVIRELKQLQILSFADSNIVKLPREIKGFTKLKLLDLRNCTNLKLIPVEVISKLYLLEELYMLNSFVGWDTRGNVRLVELQNLSHLSTLEIQIVDPKLIPEDCSFFYQLQNYKISMGDKWIWDGKYETSRILKLKLEAGIHLEGGIEALLSGTQDLYINTMMGVKSAFYEGFPELKHLHIGYDDGIQHVLNSIARTSHHGFPILESLCLYNFDRPEKIYEGEDEEIILIEVREKSVLYLDGKGFPMLKHIHILNDNTIQHRIKSTDQAFCHAIPVLESLYLINFNSLELVSFWKLRSLNVINCNKMKIVFTFSSARCLPQLQELEVAACENIEAIVGEYGHYSNKVKEFTQLSSLKLSNLPYLRGFCKRGEGTGQMKPLFNEMVLFPNLTTLEVKECKSLKYLFTTETVKCVPQLEKLEINNCEFVEEIILNKEIEEIEEESTNKILFPKLDYLSLCGLQNVRRFGSRYPIEFLSLKELSIEDCPAMESFVSKFSVSESSDYFFNEMGTFSNLETMSVRNVNTFKYFWHDQLAVDDSFFNLRSLSIAHCSKLSVVFPSYIFRRFQKLESLHLSSCDSIEEIFQYEAVDFEGRNDVQAFSFRILQMFNLPSLKYVFPEFIARRLLKFEQFEIHDCNVEVIIVKTKDEVSEGTPSFTSPHQTLLQHNNVLQPVKKMQPQEMEAAHCHNEEEVLIEFPRLCTMELKNLPYLTGFCSKREQGFGPQVCFPKLTSLELHKCNGLKYVFATSTTKSLVQLEKLEIDNCELLEEIIQSTELGEIVHNIVFSKLDNLSLEELPNLERFGCGYPIEFPSLTKLYISYCSVLKNFVSKYSSNESAEYLFNDMVSFPNLAKMEGRHINPRYLWEEQFRADDSFFKLKALKIEYCLKLSVVFPLNAYRRFLRLETLHLSCCPGVEEIYQCEGINFVEAFSLRDLEIRNLPSLKHIWRNDPSGASTFKNLQSAKVYSCKDLKYVFPKSIACGLLQLQHLKIGNSEVEVIIAKENDEKLETKGAPCFNFPRLAVVQLENLTQMSSLYEATYILKCPKLKRFEIHGCDKMMTLGSEISAYHQQNTKLKYLQASSRDQVVKLGSWMSTYQQSLFVHKFIHNLVELTLDHQGLKAIQSAVFPVEFSRLKKVTLHWLEEESIPLLFGFLRRHSLEKLVMVESFLEEIFLLDDEGASSEEQHNLTIKQLEVVTDDNLKHILKEDSRFNRILENVETLNAEHCDCLINIAPSSASFRNLTTLNVSVCFKMENLVTASTARSMVNLMDLRVSECLMMEDIVAKVRNWKKDDQIIFNKLKHLELNDLPRLSSFCSGEYTFDFPVLEEVIVNKCYQLKTFCGGRLSTPKLRAVVFEDEQMWEEDLNATITSRKSHFN